MLVWVWDMGNQCRGLKVEVGCGMDLTFCGMVTGLEMNNSSDANGVGDEIRNSGS